MPAEFQKPREEIFAQLYGEGQTSGEVVRLARDGRRVSSLCRWVMDWGAKSIMSSHTDISERKQFERERESHLVKERELRMVAESANRSKDQFLATLSHEVRTPLNAILGWATILRAGKCDSADFAEGMEVIERNCRIQARLIEDVLDISRIISGKLRLNIHPCELTEVINNAIDVVRPAANAKGLHFDVKLDQAASHCSCDGDRIQQVVWNLLTNAIKFTSREGTIRITLAAERSGSRIQIVDDGLGITPGFMPFAFDRFQQADTGTQRKFGGLGLGLSIVKHIVEMHGGNVEAYSAGEGLGSTFTIHLPGRSEHGDGLADDSPASSNEKATTGPTMIRLDGLRAMVVDDEPDARRLLVRVLGEAGATVTAAGSVTEAMTALATANPQVLVSDIAMPEQDGYDLIRQVRAAGLTAKLLPAVALTAFAHKEDRLRALMAGFQVHVAKPIDPHDLIAVIASLDGRTTPAGKVD
jgi:signal transduction histidine kinase/ActR/RegA family two-component response regulator